MKRLLLATAAMLVLATPTMADERTHVGPRADDWIQLSIPVVACPTVEGVDLFDQWSDTVARRRGGDRVVNRQAVEKWTAMYGCQIWDINDPPQTLWVRKIDSRNFFDPDTPSYSTLRLCVSSLYILGPPSPSDEVRCIWIVTDKRNVRISWGAGEKEPRR